MIKERNNGIVYETSKKKKVRTKTKENRSFRMISFQEIIGVIVGAIVISGGIIMTIVKCLFIIIQKKIKKMEISPLGWVMIMTFALVAGNSWVFFLHIPLWIKISILVVVFIGSFFIFSAIYLPRPHRSD